MKGSSAAYTACMIRGLIFDFDGLMVDTESPAYDSWQEVYREYGCELPLSLWQAVLGGSGKEFDPCAYLEQQIGQSLDGDTDLTEAVYTAVVNKRAGGMGLISSRKSFGRPMDEGVRLLNAIQDVYLCPDVTVA